MLQDDIKDQIAKATVRLKPEGDQGVLVPGDFILTAAHCVDCRCDRNMVLGEALVEIEGTHMGPLEGRTWAVEPIGDLAVLWWPDDDGYKDERFDAFCSNTEPVEICVRQFPIRESFPVYVYTHKKEWLIGFAKQPREEANKLFVEFGQQIEPGTSGGPIVDESGELVGIVSFFSENGRRCNGLQPRPHRVLPVWVVQKILGAGQD